MCEVRGLARVTRMRHVARGARTHVTLGVFCRDMRHRTALFSPRWHIEPTMNSSIGFSAVAAFFHNA